MTFLCTIEGELVPGNVNGEPRTIEFEGSLFYSERDKLTPPTMRGLTGDRHRCAFCEGYVEPAVQLDLFGAAA